jgi:hypothetical protein
MRGHRHGGGWLLRISDLEHDQSGVTAGERTAVAVAVAVDVAAVDVAAAGVKSLRSFYPASRDVER